MSPPSPKSLIDAILGNSSLLVQKYLDEGADPNANLAQYLPLLASINLNDDDYDDEEDDDVSGAIPIEHKVALYHRYGISPSALHLAVVNCYHRSKMYRSTQSTHDKNDATEIVRSLLKHGADPSAVTTTLVVTNIEGYHWLSFDASQNKTASGLAIFLKNYPWVYFKSETSEALDKVIEIVLHKDIELLQGIDVQRQQCQNQIQILETTAQMYEKLLLSQAFSDIRIVCSDGVQLPAHRNILWASSEFFKSELQGPWAESNNDNKWQTSHASKIMKAVLTFIYTGRVHDDLLKIKPLQLYAIAAEYKIVSLKVIAENKCITSLHCGNVKTILLAAQLHDNYLLLKACFSFVQNNAAQVLTNREMVNLATEDPDLWEELTRAIAPPATGSSKKRVRTS